MALGTCADLIASKGTKVYIGAALPATYDADGYDAVSWTEIGMVESVGEYGADSSIGTYTPIGTGVACKYMGTTDFGEISLTIADTSDSGLAALKAHRGDTAYLPFKIEFSEVGATTEGHSVPAKHRRHMFIGLTKSYRHNIGSGDDVSRVNASIVLNGEYVEGAAAASAAS